MPGKPLANGKRRKSTMKQVYAGIIGLLSIVACALPACAGDMYRGGWEPSGYKDATYPIAPWAGFYFGPNGGGGWSQQSDQLGSPGVFNGLGLSGGFAGLQAGYNWQGRFGYDRLLLGIEADIQASAVEAKKGDGVG